MGMAFRKTFRSATVCVITAAIVGTIVALLITSIRGVPAPSVHDEFAYLLGADTFASGRLTNPTHPMWEHFETFHVIQNPTYMCKYQPAQSLALAGGKWLGHPIVGACLTTGFAIGCLVWMLTGWLPRKYFWLITLFAVLHPGLQIVWGQSYWGGNIAFAGASLLLGALGRLTSKFEIRYSIVAALGTLLLANSRPFEGALLTVAVGLALIGNTVRFSDWKLGRFCLRVIVPGFVVLGIGIAGMLKYNSVVTGDPLEMPYRVHEATYGWNPLFLWETAGEKPDYRHPIMENFFAMDKAINDAKYQTLVDVLAIKSSAAFSMVKFFCGGTLILAALGLPWMIRRPRFRLAGLLAVPVLLASLATPWAWAHYCAPAAPLLILIFCACWIEIWKRTQAVPLMRAAVLIILPLFHVIWWTTTYSAYGEVHQNGWANHRVDIEHQLRQRPGKDLVLVRYTDEHNPNAEWVYNDADIDAAPIVWAREMSVERRRLLIEFFDDRNVWVVAADAQPPLLMPFREESLPEPQFGMKTK